jgi:hypothetical protein
MSNTQWSGQERFAGGAVSSGSIARDIASFRALKPQ